MSISEAALFGQLLRATRKAHKLPLAHVAEKVDIGVKHLARIERGEKKPSFDLIVSLANAMKVSPAAFFDFETLQIDEKSLGLQIKHMLDRRNVKDLVRAKRILSVLLEGR